MKHIPVLLKEVIEYLDPKPGENFIDATFGGGGHAREILKKIAPDGKLLGMDWDQQISPMGPIGPIGRMGSKLDTRPPSLKKSEPLLGRSGIEFGSFPRTQNNTEQTQNNAENFQRESASSPPDSAFIIEWGNFAEIENISAKHFPEGVDGVLFDFGLSSDQLEASGRGFSYLKDEPLDMRFYRSGTSIEGTASISEVGAPTRSVGAAEIVNKWPEKELARIFREYGEERNSPKIARAIAEARKQKNILTTGELVEVMDPALEKDKFYLAKANLFQGRGRTKTLSRIFQALRIAANDELENIKRGLAGAWQILKPGGRLGAISFHSLEDRLVKNFFLWQKNANEGEILTKKPVTPTEEEIRENSRSRSAKLRAIRKLKV